MKAAMKSCSPPWMPPRRPKATGIAVAGTVAGDIHEFGKASLLDALRGRIEVTDAGCDVAPEAFVATCQAVEPDLLLLSALLTTTMPNQQKTIEALKAAGLRETIKVMVSGAPTTRAWADEIGADGYTEAAIGPWWPPRACSAWPRGRHA